MLKLAEIIREGLRIKQARKEELRGVKVPEEKPKAEPEVPIVPQPQIVPTPPPTPEPIPPPAPPPPPGEAAPEVKEEVEAESTMSLIQKEIEALELTVDEENKVYRFGNLTTLDFKDLEGCNPVMAATKIKEAIKDVLLKKYEVESDELEKRLEELRKKFRTFGTHCYVRSIKQKM
ncbi:hypothetical protein KAX00_00685 [bacterium]|nr:hypothetical protein [bacterium]